LMNISLIKEEGFHGYSFKWEGTYAYLSWNYKIMFNILEFEL
jgi:hypothetical protein